MGRYGLRLSGHSLGAGCAAVATEVLRRHPERFPELFNVVDPTAVTCFCASAPPVFSLEIARAARDHTTALTLGHDVVARASIANLEQLRLEVLSSGWWEALVDPIQKSAAAEQATRTLNSVGAKAMAVLAAAQRPHGAAASGSSGRPQSEVDLDNVMRSLHYLYIAPTVRAWIFVLVSAYFGSVRSASPGPFGALER